MLILQQPTNQELPKILNELYEEFFIKRAEKYGDIYLKCIGLWGQQKYIEAVNSLQFISTQNEIEFIFEQDNGYQMPQKIQKQTNSRVSKQIVDSKKHGLPKDTYLPALSDYQGYELLVMVNKLIKAPKVTQALDS